MILEEHENTRQNGSAEAATSNADKYAELWTSIEDFRLKSVSF